MSGLVFFVCTVFHWIIYSVFSCQTEEAPQKKQHDADRAPQVGVGSGPASDHPTSHWRSRLTLNVVGDHFIFDRDYLPSDVHRYLRV